VKNLLFICSRNQWRSPTAEAIWRKIPDFSVRSAGTSPKAKRTVSSEDIRWADMIFVMEKKHKNRLVAKFTRMLNHNVIILYRVVEMKVLWIISTLALMTIGGCASHVPMNGNEIDIDQYCRQEIAWTRQTMNMDRDEFGPTLGSGGVSDYESNIPVVCEIR